MPTPPLDTAPAAPPRPVPRRRRDPRDELRLLINSRHPILVSETSEESRVEDLLAQVADELDIPFYSWSVTTGLTRRGTSQPIYQTDQPELALANIAQLRGDAVFLLKDFARYLDQDRILRRMRELAASFRDWRRSILLTAPIVKLPPELEDDAVPFHFDLPDAVTLLPLVQRTLAEVSAKNKLKLELDADGHRSLAQNLIGLTVEEARRTLTKCLLDRRAADAQTIADVLDARRASLKQEGCLEYLKSDFTFADLAGLSRLKDWLRKRRGALTPEGRQFGLEPPKGVLLTGVQGCGKSLAARAVAGEWGIDLARLDAGSLYDKYIGESEKRLRRALDLAVHLAPIVLWIDEIEKGFAGTTSSADVDAGLSQRLLGTFLTWLQDRPAGVFIVATSNDISALPPELLRKGRFDEIFFVDLPDDAARAELFRIHLQRRGRAPRDFDLPALAAASDGFSGAEIEQAVISGLYSAFEAKQKLSTPIVIHELRSTKPLSVTRAESVAALRRWASSRASPAN